ncbi:MAG TPA: Stk1 family PASTA domain-containing Ser/Thr kinase [Actinobacteria bacterium]|nr:serine/threonine-protein kinase PknB [bacterium BMS3Bbin01]HDH26483.1 Stk1 family PASTA domain-containing Ser/Thr kinase [Actinomycetota bacterium]
MEHTVLADRYELLSHLARGGMADVFEARDTLLGRRVAVKMLHSQYATDEAFVRRFRREAQAAANLSHPNIVGIFDWGQEAGTYFIVMELVDGRSVRDVLKVEGPLLPRRAVEIASEVAAALSVAHRAGVVHRDIKPGNIMLTGDGTVKVTDFGIARAWDDSSELTKTGAVIGTATYFSPEQAQGVPADERSDLYSLGVVLYEMLAGHPPFSGESPVSVAYQHVSTAVSAPSAVNPDVSPDLDRIVLHALDKNPDTRYQTAEEIRQDLLLFLRGETPGAVSSNAPTQMMPPVGLPPATSSPDGVYRQVQQDRGPRSQLPFVITAFALLVALGVGIFLLLQQLPSAPPEPITVSVPDVAGRTLSDAMIEVQKAGFTAIPKNTESSSVPKDMVVGTDPPAFTEKDPGSLVKVLISIGPKASPVPPLVGESEAVAIDLITQNKFIVKTIRRPDPTAPKGQVIDQDPAPGEKYAPDTVVTITVSDGPAIITIPAQLPGRSEGDVGFLLGNEGLLPEFQYEYSDEQPAGLVIRTEPGAGEPLPAGSPITVVISKGPQPVAVPDLTGMTQDQARSALEAVGLQLGVSATTVETGPEQDGKVVTQSITPGNEVKPATIVQVTLGKAPPTTTTSSTTTTTAP